jgi:hypothetical protein
MRRVASLLLMRSQISYQIGRKFLEFFHRGISVADADYFDSFVGKR